MKIIPVGAEFFQRDGRTDRQAGRYDEVNSRFFANLLTQLKIGKCVEGIYLFLI
jgi:hypothetical protein